MPNSWALPPNVRRSLRDPIAGDVIPRRANPPLRDVDGRTVALRTLFDYLAALTYRRAGDRGGPAIEFKIPREHFFTEWPDGVEQTKFPSVACLEGSVARRMPNGLAYAIAEETADVFGRGTVVLRTDEWVEEVTLEVWASMRAQRRALLAGIEGALSTTEGVAALRLILRDYFGTTCRYRIVDSRLSGDQDNADGRRRGDLTVQMSFCLGVLVDANTLNPIVSTHVTTPWIGPSATTPGSFEPPSGFGGGPWGTGWGR